MALLTITTGGLRPLPLSLLSQAIPMLSRSELEDVVERLIDRLDEIDGDPDAEEDDLEDAFALSWRASGSGHGPGCPLSDPGGQSDEDETNTGPRQYLAHGTHFQGAGCPISDPGEANR